jgi:hypothetical protein
LSRTFTLFVIFFPIITALLIIGLLLWLRSLSYKNIEKMAKHWATLRKLIDSGEYKVYLDGTLIDDPLGIDVRQYISQIDEERKIIRFTTEHSTNVTVNNYNERR